MLDNVDIRAAMMAWLKGNSTILAALSDTDEIRELHWQGESFTYPDIRVTSSSIPNQCNYSDVTMIISFYSEEKSSKQAITGQGVIAKQMHEKSIEATVGSTTIKFENMRVTLLPDAIQEDGVWKANVNLSMRASEV